MLTVTRKSKLYIGDALRQLAKEADHKRRTILGEAGQMMVAQTKQRMAQSVAPNGKRWKKLAPRTIAEKGHAKPLFKTGDLNRSIQVLSLSNDSVAVGPTMGAQKKALTQQFGRPKIDDVTFKVPAHTRKAHTRQQGGKTVKVKAHTVQAHTRKGTLPEIPARPFLGFSPRSDRGRREMDKLAHMIAKRMEEVSRGIHS